MNMCRLRFMVVFSCLPSSDSLSGSYTGNCSALAVTMHGWSVCLGMAQHAMNCTLSAIGPQSGCLPDGCYGLSGTYGEFKEKKKKKRLPDSVSAVSNEKERQTTKAIKFPNP